MQIPTQMGPKSLNVHKTAKDGHIRAAWYGFALYILTLFVENCFTCDLCRPPGPGSKDTGEAA